MSGAWKNQVGTFVYVVPFVLSRLFMLVAASKLNTSLLVVSVTLTSIQGYVRLKIMKAVFSHFEVSGLRIFFSCSYVAVSLRQ